MAVVRHDGTPFRAFLNRQITVAVTYENQQASTRTSEDKLIIPDDNIVKFRVTPQEADFKIKIRVDNFLLISDTNNYLIVIINREFKIEIVRK